MTYTHKFYTRLSKRMPENRQNVLEMINRYRFVVTEEANFFQLQGDNFSLEIAIIANEANITLNNKDSQFDPENKNQEYSILGHYLEIAGTQELIKCGQINQLTKANVYGYVNSQPLTPEKFQKLLSLSPVKFSN